VFVNPGTVFSVQESQTPIGAIRSVVPNPRTAFVHALFAMNSSRLKISDEVRAEIRDLLNRAETVSLVQSIRQLFALLEKHDLMHKSKLRPGLVGCHQENRDGYGVNGHDVAQLATDIYGIGFDPTEVKAVAAQIDQSDTITIDFNTAMVAQSFGLLAPIEASLQYASLWGSHTNQVLRAFAANVPHTNPDITVDGKLNLSKLRLTDPTFADAVEQGVEWSIISWRAIKEFPRLANLVQAAACSGF
jgi:hypothetical protein